MIFRILKSASGPRRILMIATFISLVLIVLCSVLVICVQLAAGGNTNADIPGGAQTGNKKDYTTIPVASSDVYAKGTLLVVNGSTPIQVYPSDSQLVTIYGENKTSSYKVNSSTLRLQNDALVAFNNMLDAYYAATNDNTITLTSAYRTQAEQEALSSSAIKAGYSDHHLALSVAIRHYDGSTTSYPTEDNWLYLNGYKYGYIQRYPAGKEASTGDTQEYYNCLRYVGVPHATYMHEKNLSLEEYVAAVKNYTYDGEHLSITVGTTVYEVYYVPANLTGAADAVTTLPVPKDGEYTFSGNNTDGFIVTVTRS